MNINRREFLGTAGAAAAASVIMGLKPTYTIAANNPKGADTSKIMNYNSDMEYRLCGKTGWMVSAACLGGHWKRVDKMVPGLFKGGAWLSLDVNNADFCKNRYDVVTRCIERGINYIDACTYAEVIAYSKALKGRRDKMYLGWSWYEHEARRPEFRKAEKLLETLDGSLKETGETYVDLWRITCIADARKGPNGEQVLAHTEAESAEIAKALEAAKKSGKARCTGVSSHDRPWLEYLMKTFPNQIDAVVTPYTAKSKVLEKDSFFDTVQQCKCGFFGIKPFSGTSLFKGDSSPDPQKNSAFEEDNRLARLAIRYILCNPAITAPIPGMINPQQVDNIALAVNERRELDAKEKAELDTAMDLAWANLPPNYQWLKDWEYV
ncbi:MAG: aldo/keto reductase [Kiritimatiellae bacterium]|nr:aldo/keto reductase [Kiritimatiellia bacterium]MDD5521010.1 aldo/keto reductase [Kiritimatiellia bacterium]